MRHLCPALTLIALSLLSWPTDAREPRRAASEQPQEAQDASAEYAALAQDRRLKAIIHIKEIISHTENGPVRAEMALRLAELYVEEARYLYFEEMEAFAARERACEDQYPGCDPATLSPDHTDSRKLTASAARLYKRIRSTHPDFERGDEAAWYLSVALDELGEPIEALKARTDLVRDFPDSFWAASAYIQIGEYHFDHGDVYKALLAYEAASRIPDHDKLDYARYRLGWCYFNVGEYGKAIALMNRIATRPPAAEDGAIRLAEEARRDLVRFYVEAGEIDQAITAIGGLPITAAQSADLMARMADQLTETGQFQDSVRVWRTLLSADPTAARAPEYHDAIIAILSETGPRDQVLAELARSGEWFSRDTPWFRRHAGDPEVLQSALELRESRTRRLATDLHQEARKLRDTAAFAQAGEVYAAWLAEFGGLEEEAGVRYAYGELLYTLKRYGEAHTQYAAVVALDPTGPHARFCAEAAIHAAQKVVDGQGEVDGPLTRPERDLLSAADTFLAMFPDDKLAQSVTYRSAWLLYQRDQLDEAAERFREVIAMEPSTGEAINSAHLIQDALAIAERWDTLVQTSLAFYEQEGLGDATFKQETWAIHERASFKRIEARLARDGDQAAAAADWQRFAADFPGSEIADMALNNAAVSYHRRGLIRSAMACRLALLTEHPGSPYAPDQMAALGFDYETIADFSEAARWYEALHALAPDHESAPDALYSAAVFRRSMGELEHSMKDAQALAGIGDPRAAGLLIDIGIALTAADRHEEADVLYRTLTAAPPAGTTPDQLTHARLARARALLSLERRGESVAIWEALVADGATGEAFAEARTGLLADQLAAYKALRVDGVQRPGQPRSFDQRLQRQLAEKGQALQALEAEYAAVIDTGSLTWGLLALVSLGEAYEDMAQTFLTSPIPPHLTAQQREIYIEKLEDFAWMQEQRAVEAYSEVMAQSMKARSYDESTAVALGRLEILDGEAWPALSEELIRAGFTTGEGYGVGLKVEPE